MLSLLVIMEIQIKTTSYSLDSQKVSVDSKCRRACVQQQKLSFITDGNKINLEGNLTITGQAEKYIFVNQLFFKFLLFSHWLLGLLTQDKIWMLQPIPLSQWSVMSCYLLYLSMFRYLKFLCNQIYQFFFIYTISICCLAQKSLTYSQNKKQYDMFLFPLQFFFSILDIQLIRNIIVDQGSYIIDKNN